MELVDYVAIAALICTYGSFLSGAQICARIYKQKSSDKISHVPFFAGLICLTMWLRYGFLFMDWTMITVNSVGLVCQLVYIIFFLVYSSRQASLAKQLAFVLIFTSSLLWIIDHYNDPVFINGIFATTFSLIACASPLAAIQDVIRTRTVAALPFPIIVSSFIVSSLWLAYGYLVEDSFLQFSNAVATCISGSQLLLFAIYPSAPSYTKLKTKRTPAKSKND